MRIGAVLMASGAARRFGANKLLQAAEGSPMIERVMEAVPARLFERAVVVSAYPEILTLAGERGYRPVANPHAAEGQAASIRLGVSALRDMDGALFAVCDQPWLRRESVERLLRACRENPGCICALSWRGRRGNPAVFPAALFPELAALTGEQRGAAVIKAHRELLRLVEASCARELLDVDTPADLEART